ncbi:MAG: Lrp/AsnC family transcriptional regulator [Solirubrobacteraceae bacterium]
MTSLDRLDAGILELLTVNPRIGLVEVARRLGVARGTVQARLAKLVDRGAVTGFGPEVDPARIGYPVLAFVFLEIAQGRLNDAVTTLDEIPEVLEAFGTTGPRDLICRVVARDNGHLQEIINAILHSPSVRRSTSYIAMSTQIAPRRLPLVRAAATP